MVQAIWGVVCWREAPNWLCILSINFAARAIIWYDMTCMDSAKRFKIIHDKSDIIQVTCNMFAASRGGHVCGQCYVQVLFQAFRKDGQPPKMKLWVFGVSFPWLWTKSLQLQHVDTQGCAEGNYVTFSVIWTICVQSWDVNVPVAGTEQIWPWHYSIEKLIQMFPWSSTNGPVNWIETLPRLYRWLFPSAWEPRNFWQVSNQREL